jgi:hypothetical protein
MVPGKFSRPRISMTSAPPPRTPTDTSHSKGTFIMYRKIWTNAVLLATAGPAAAGLQTNHCEPLVRR